tara:strand:- start:335 stop:508 length:174 start_codon:yes stop_codon:yes gene_type:complete
MNSTTQEIRRIIGNIPAINDLVFTLLKRKKHNVNPRAIDIPVCFWRVARNANDRPRA